MTMNRDRIRNGKSTSAIHALVVAEPERARPSGRALLMMSMAVVFWIAVALLWFNQNPRGTLETLPDAVAQATLSAVAPTAGAPTDEPTASAVEVDATLPAVADANVVKMGLVASSRNAAANSSNNLSAQLVPAQQVTLAPPTPTATLTPLPPLDRVEAVVAIGGVTLWDGTSGLLMGQAPQGALFTATARSTDGQWLYGTLEDGSNGWASIDQLIVFDAERLRSEDVVIMPITPTPVPLADEAVPAAQAPGQVTVAAGQAGSATEMPVLRPTPVAGNAPLAQVTLQGSRLNLRAGPASSYPVIAKAFPDESFAVLGRDATSQWLQLAVPDVVDGFAWAAAEFLTTAARIADLPVVTDVSNAPAYQENQNAGQTQGNATKGGLPVASLPEATAGQPESRGALSGAAVATAEPPVANADGLTGKLAIQTSWGGDISLYDFATGELRLLTGGFDPAISPDGTQVAFTRVGGEHGLYVINVDGSNERKVFSERTEFHSPKWSPDGKYILFERGDELLNCTLLDPDDAASKCLVDREPEDATEVQQKLARVDLNGENYQDIPVLPRARVPDWNSAGIVYQSPAGIQMTQDQPGAQTKSVFFNIRKQYELDPDWQPNGGRIIFQRRENDHWEIYSVAPDGSGLTALTHPTFTLVEKLPSNVAPAWSPDGQHIVYLSNRQPNQSAGDWGVWVMDADGSNQHRLDIDLPFIYTFVAEQMLDWGR
jgi:Tol biopolymer transport system component